MSYTFKAVPGLRASLLTLLTLGAAVLSGHAASVTGSYTFMGTTTPTNQTGPWNMTSTDTTFGVLRFVFDTPVLFQDITSLSYGYDVNLGGIAGGAPRAVFVLSSGDSFYINWGPAGSFVDSTVGNNLNTGNLLSLTDVGRYDLGGIGGSIYSDRATALALAGTASITRISLVIDSFGGNNRDIDINSVNVSAATATVPDSGSTLALFGLGVTGLAGFSFRRRIRSN